MLDDMLEKYRQNGKAVPEDLVALLNDGWQEQDTQEIVRHAPPQRAAERMTQRSQQRGTRVRSKEVYPDQFPLKVAYHKLVWEVYHLNEYKVAALFVFFATVQLTKQFIDALTVVTAVQMSADTLAQTLQERQAGPFINYVPATIIQYYLTRFEAPLWRWQFSFLGVLALIFDAFINAGGMYPTILYRLASVPSTMALADALAYSPEIDKATALIISCIFGSIVCCLADLMYHFKSP